MFIPQCIVYIYTYLQDSQSYDECWPDAHLYHHHHHLHHHHIHQHSSTVSQMWPITHNHSQQQSLTQNPASR